MPETDLARELAWTERHMPRLRRALAGLPDLRGVRLACSMHLDLKMVPLVAGLLSRGAAVFLTTCNPATVRDEVVAHLRALGANGSPWRAMPADDWRAAFDEALAWGPTHLCEMGADLSAALYQSAGGSRQGAGGIRAGLEATGSGIARLVGMPLDYPVFNWDDVPVKEGLHNRYMVGLTTWHTFFTRTRLTLHGRRVLVVCYGLVGRGLADTARAYGGAVMVAERDPARALEAAYAGWQVLPLAEALPLADVVVTATGATGVLGADTLPLLRDGAFLINVGHRDDEIDTSALLIHPHEQAMPYVTAIQLAGRTVYLFANGSMANLTAGEGDSLNAFDVTLAVMTAAIGYSVGAGQDAPPGVHLLPRSVWESWVGP